MGENKPLGGFHSIECGTDNTTGMTGPFATYNYMLGIGFDYPIDQWVNA